MVRAQNFNSLLVQGLDSVPVGFEGFCDECSRNEGQVHGFMFIDTFPGKDRAVLERVVEFDEVVEAHLISGQYDLLVVLEIDLHGKPVFTTVQEVAHNSIEKIRNINGVRDTNTIVPFSSVTKRAE
jgi:DNA-binding Lrp family transcriptional regulator